MLTALLPATGQSQATLVAIGVVGGLLVVAGIAAMIGVRVSKNKNSASKTFTADAKPAGADDAADEAVAETPAAKKAPAKKPAAKKPAAKKPAKSTDDSK